MKRQNRSDEILIGALGEFSQQIVALRMTAEAHEKYRRQGAHHPVILNSLVVSFAIHFRNILDFLYSGGYATPPAKSDVIAEDFFSSPGEWRSLAPPISEGAKTDRKRLNKHIAHITYDRIGLNMEDRLWHFEQNLSDVSTGIETFYNNVDRRFLDRHFDKELLHPIWAKRIKVKRSKNDNFANLLKLFRPKNQR